MNFICTTCGTQHVESPSPPACCPICEDERQYVGFDGQEWTTLDDLRREHHNTIQQEEADLTSIVTEPKFGIGERAFVLRTGQDNLLWDCISLIDDATIANIHGLGG